MPERSGLQIRQIVSNLTLQSTIAVNLVDPATILPEIHVERGLAESDSKFGSPPHLPTRPASGSPNTMPRPQLTCLLLLLLVALPSSRSQAGGGPENVLVVVNSLSEESRTIANHYVRLRGIPASNVVEIRWQGSQYAGTADRLRRDLLLPVIRAIDQRKLGLQIDCIAYSAGFPTRFDFKADFPDQKFSKASRPVASLTGATYLFQYAIRKNAGIVMPSTNWYVSPNSPNNIVRCRTPQKVATRAFHSSASWSQAGTAIRDPDKGQRYLMSTMLGVTVGRGNSVEEVIASLRRAKLADHTKPDGTFYFAQNKDIRSKTRHACYAGTVQLLQAEGAKAKVVSGKVPTGALDIVGFTVGAVEPNLTAARTKVLPGAICEHLTSFGGDLRSRASQMPLSEFIRAGAAGASGTVTEPTAIQAKFPLPTVHLHYRRGCSLAEAFYQSVRAPYQLLIVGDPLCQPWASPPKVEVAGLDAPDSLGFPQRVGGVVNLTATVDPGVLKPKRPAEVFLDGRLLARVSSGKQFPLDTHQLAEGFHDLCIVAKGSDAIEATARSRHPLWVDNTPDNDLQFTTAQQIVSLGAEIELVVQGGQGKQSLQLESRDADNESPAEPDQPPVETEVSEKKAAAQPVVLPEHFRKSSGQVSQKVTFWYNSVKLGEAQLAGKPPTAKLRVSAARLGRGPVRLIAQQQNGGQSMPIWVVVQ